MDEKRQIVVLLRWVLVIALSYLVIYDQKGSLDIAGLCTAVLLLSNLVLMRVPLEFFRRKGFELALVTFDVALITTTLLLCGSVDPDMFFVLLFVVFLASIGERVEVTSLGALLAGSAYLFFLSQTESILTARVLLRVPFFFIAALTYGYLGATARDARARARLAEGLLEAKSNFLASVSHEVRTPLHVIAGYGSMLEEGHFGHLTAEQTAAVQKIIGNATELRNLVDRMLTASRLESGELALHLEPIRAVELFGEIREAATPYRRPGVDFTIGVDADMPLIVTDRLKVKELVTNLVTNALKYTPSGHVSAWAHYRPGRELIEIVVRDSGIGMDAHTRQRMFEPFARAADAERTGIQGAGLGLYIVRRLLTALEGELQVESEPGRGSTFAVTLPVVVERLRATA